MLALLLAVAAPAPEVADGAAVGRPFKSITAFAVSPDGRLAAVAEGKAAFVLNTVTGKEVRRLPAHRGDVVALAFSPDGKRLASGALDKSVRIHDLTGDGDGTLNALDGEALCLAFSADGKRLAAGGVATRVRIMDAATGKTVADAPRCMYHTAGLAFTPDGRTLAILPDSHRLMVPCIPPPPLLRLHDLASGKARDLYSGHLALSAGVFSADGRRLVTGHGGDVALWDIDKGKPAKLTACTVGKVRLVVPSPDGKILAAGGPDGVVRLFDAVKLEEAAPMIRLRGDAVGAAFLPDGRTLLTASARGLIQKWRVNEPGRRAFHILLPEWGASSVAVSPDGKTLALGTMATGAIRTLRRIDLATCKELSATTLPGTGNVLGHMAYSPDGRFIATGDSSVRLFDASNGKLLHSAETSSSWLEGISVRSDGKAVTTYGAVWDADTGKPLAGTGLGMATFAAAAPRVAGFVEGGVAVNDWKTGKTLTRYRLPGAGARVALSPDGGLLAVSLGDGTVILFGDGKELGRLPEKMPARLLAFSADGARLAVCSDRGGKVAVWDTRGKRPHRVWQAQAGNMTGLAFTPDGKTLITVGEERMARAWDPTTGEEVVTLK